MLAIYEVPTDAAEAPEQLGSKPKFWFVDPNGRRLLFKEARSGTGEDWAEKFAAELCKLVELPHGDYELAIWRDRRGVVSPTFVPAGGRLVLGNELLGRFVEGYDGSKTYEQRQHTVLTVMSILRAKAILLPPASTGTPALERACDLFCGYLMLDALIGNTDRHHENWGLILHADRKIEIAPTFDHASSLGRNESDESREKRLKGGDPHHTVSSYAARARSGLYSSQPGTTKALYTVDAFYEAARLRPSAGKYWLQLLAKLQWSGVEAIVNDLPSTIMSNPAKEFATEMLKVNKDRLLERQGELP